MTYIRSEGDPIFGAFGQSAPFSRAVEDLQKALIAAGLEVGAEGADGRYGLSTHAALVRAARDILEPAGLATTTCRSTCNSLRTRALGACADCIDGWLRALSGKLSGYAPSSSDRAAVVSAYRSFLAAWIADHGEGGEGDTNAGEGEEDLIIDGSPPSGDVPGLPGEGGGDVPPVVGDLPPAVVAKAGMPWWGWALILATGGGIVYAVVQAVRRKSGPPMRPVRPIPLVRPVPPPFFPGLVAPRRPPKKGSRKAVSVRTTRRSAPRRKPAARKTARRAAPRKAARKTSRKTSRKRSRR